MSTDHPEASHPSRQGLSKLPLVLLLSLIAGYWITSSSLLKSPDAGSGAAYSQEADFHGPESGDTEPTQPTKGFIPHKYHAVCRACNFPGLPPAKVPATPKTSIHVVGERHSGTNAMEQLLRLNFDIKVDSSFTMHKHFLQPYPRWPADYSRHLIVLTVVNVYDWVAAMRRSCYHCEALEGLALPDFLAARVRSHPADVNFYTALAKEPNTSRLQGKLRWRQAAAPGGGEAKAHGGGKGDAAPPAKPAVYVFPNNTKLVPPVFSNVMAMRRLKICQMLDLALRFSIDIEILRLEDFLYPHHQIELMRRLHYAYRLPLRPEAETFNATTDALDEAGEEGPPPPPEGGGGGEGEPGAAAAGAEGEEEEEGSGGGGGQEGGQGEAGWVAEELGKIKPLQTMAKLPQRKRKFRPQRKLRLSVYYRGTLGALEPGQRQSVALVNTALDWQLELGLGWRIGRCQTVRVCSTRRPGDLSPEEMEHLLLRLQGDDVEYYELKAHCKARGLGGKDSKDNLRAKLVKNLREELLGAGAAAPGVSGGAGPGPGAGAPGGLGGLSSGEWDRQWEGQQAGQAGGAGEFQGRAAAQQQQQQQQQSQSEPPPQQQQQQEGEGEDYAPTYPPPLDPEGLAKAQAAFAAMQRSPVPQLRELLRARGLSSSGTREALTGRLYEALGREAVQAFGGRKQLALYAQEAVRQLSEGEVYEELGARGMNTSCPPNQAVAELEAVVVREWVEDALYAGLSQQLTPEALAAAASSPPPGTQAATAEQDWAPLERPLPQQQELAQEQGAAGASWRQGEWPAQQQQQQQQREESWGQGMVGGARGDAQGSAAAAAAAGALGQGVAGAQHHSAGSSNNGEYPSPAAGAAAAAAVAGDESAPPAKLPVDPPMTVAVLCCGPSTAQREAAVKAARLAVQLLQSDPCHGTLPAAQLWQGQDQPVTKVAVGVYYALPSGTLCALSWERLHGASAEELDTCLELEGAQPEAADLLAAADLVLPLGLPPAALGALLEGASAKVVGASALPGAASLAADPIQLQDRLRKLGYPTLGLLRLGLEHFAPLAVPEGDGGLESTAAYRAVAEWLSAQGRDLENARVAVRAEQGEGAVADGAMVHGIDDSLQAALAMIASEGVESVVLEAPHPQGAVYFTCTVLGAEQGCAALPPTQLDLYDLGHDFLATYLAYDRFLALQQGEDAEEVDAYVDSVVAESSIHPAYLGGPATPTQQLRRATPPAGLGAEASQALRRAATKLFQELGLRDYAQFSGWVLPARLAAAPAAGGSAAGPAAQGAGTDEAPAPSSKPQGRSFAELLDDSPPPPAAAPAHQPQSESAGAAGGGGGVDLARRDESHDYSSYGWFNGIRIDGGSRLDWIKQNIKPDPRVKPIPDERPSPVVQSLEDLSPLSPADACTLPGGAGTVHFASLALTPDLASPAGLLFQQGASVGVSHRALARQLLAPALARAGLEPLPLLPPAEAGLDVFEEPGERLPSTAKVAAAAQLDSAVPAKPEDAGLDFESDPIADARVDLEAVGLMVVQEADEIFMAPPLTAEQVAELERLDLEGGHEQMSDGSWQDSALVYEREMGQLAAQQAQQQQQLLGGGGEPQQAQQEGRRDGGGEEEAESLFDEVELEEWDRLVGAGADADSAAGAAADVAGQPTWRAGAPAAAQQAQQQQALQSADGPLGLGAFGEAGPGQGWDQDGEPARSQRFGGATGENGAARRHRVWILFGGEGPQREASLESGLHAYLQLRDHPALDVEAFLLEPSDCGPAEEQRRRELLAKRLALLKLGADDDFFAEAHPELLESRIVSPPPPSASLGAGGVWRLRGAGVLRGSVPEMQAGCEAALGSCTVAPANLEAEQIFYGAEYLEGGQRVDMLPVCAALAAVFWAVRRAAACEAHSVTQQELSLAGVQLDGSPWGGAAEGSLTQPGPPGYTFLDDWAAEAAAEGAVVLPALCGAPAALGPLQRLLDEHGVRSMGSGVTATETCADKAVLMQQLVSLESHGISTAPQHRMSLPELAAQCADEAAADTLFSQLSGYLGSPGASLCIKPATSSWGLGVARIGCGRDLLLYAAALDSWATDIPAGLLSQQQDSVAMVVPPPTQYIVEPYITAEVMQLRRRADGSLLPPSTPPPFPPQHSDAGRRALESSLHWGGAAEGGNPWVEVVAHMCGEQGRMICLGPSVAVAEFQEDPMASARSVSASGDSSSSGGSVSGSSGGMEQGEGAQRAARERAVAALAALERQLAERRRREGSEEEAATAAAAAAGGELQQDAAAGAAAGATQASGSVAPFTSDVTSATSSDAEREAAPGVDRERSGSSGGEAAAAPEAAAGPHLVRVFELTPPPSSWVQPQAVANFKLRMEMVADRLGLAGVARIEAFMNSETGDVVVSDVDPLPQLGPDALIFKQAAVEEVPFSPENVFLELLRVGLAQAQEPQGAELAGELAGYSDLEASLEADDQLLGGRDLDAPGWQEDDASWRYDPDFSQAPQ
ncbi:hypothetical protein N2152v2_004529 [Parachlorella kessleri]